jgi:2-keto-4-pentenoate hydratase/2-oxohepta-3-ene-1,7-dioic acid hydratase in catechol pathway
MYLKPGDTVVIEIEGLGSLRHEIIAWDDPRSGRAISKM